MAAVPTLLTSPLPLARHRAAERQQSTPHHSERLNISCHHCTARHGGALAHRHSRQDDAAACGGCAGARECVLVGTGLKHAADWTRMVRTPASRRQKAHTTACSPGAAWSGGALASPPSHTSLCICTHGRQQEHSMRISHTQLAHTQQARPWLDVDGRAAASTWLSWLQDGLLPAPASPARA